MIRRWRSRPVSSRRVRPVRSQSVALVLVMVAAGGTTGCNSEKSASASAEQGPINAFPAPGTETAGARTEVSLRGVAPDAVGEVSVSGSRSGEVRGDLEPHADGAGVSFVPKRRLRSGERISVSTDLAVRGATDGDFRFTIGRRPDPGQVNDGNLELPDIPPGTADEFRSSDLQMPKIRITEPAATRTAPGEIFLSPVSLKDNPNPDGPMILGEQGQPVWFQQSEGATVFDLKVQRYKDEPVLTWWEGRFALGWGYGEYIVFDQSYREVVRLSAGNGLRGDFHDMILTPRDTALVLVYDRVKRDLRPVGGPRDGVVINNVIQEIEPETGRVLFEWHSVGNVPFEASRVKRDGNRTWDYFHPNSIEIDDDGNLLVSGRNTCAVYKISPDTGETIWTLGGTQSDFEMGPGSRFCLQHDARRVSEGLISLFDNAAGPPQVRQESRAIVLEVDEQAKTAKLASAYTHPGEFLSPNQSSARVQSNGNMFVGWGPVPVFSEFSPDGELLFSGTIESGKGSYRAVRSEWTGLPRTKPAVAVQERGDRLAVWASWNGATEVARWEVLSGSDQDALTGVRTVGARGFETAISVPGGESYVAVRALDSSGTEIGRSRALDVSEDSLPHDEQD